MIRGTAAELLAAAEAAGVRFQWVQGELFAADPGTAAAAPVLEEIHARAEELEQLLRPRCARCGQPCVWDAAEQAWACPAYPEGPAMRRVYDQVLTADERQRLAAEAAGGDRVARRIIEAMRHGVGKGAEVRDGEARDGLGSDPARAARGGNDAME